MKGYKNYLWGIVIFCIGTILALNAIGVTSINLFFTGWWTFVIIIPSLIEVITGKNKKVSLSFLVIGILIFLIDLKILTINLLFAIMLICLGLYVIIGNKTIRKIRKINSHSKESYDVNSVLDNEFILKDEEFKGVYLKAVYGDINCDLKEAYLKEDRVINCLAIFGDIELNLPKDVNVIVKSHSIGTTINNYNDKNKLNKDAKTIYVNIKSLFSKVDINQEKRDV